MTVRARAPVRLDLAGGWTDVPPFSTREGGMVVSSAIGLSASAEVSPRESGFRLVSEDLNHELEAADATALSPGGPLVLLQAALRVCPAGPCTLVTRSDAPPGSGLGSSGALDVAMVAALSAARGASLGPGEIAELACRLEAVEAGLPGGRQDQYTAAFGGVVRLGFRDPAVEVEPLQLDPEFLEELARRTVLCYTGASRFSGATIGRVMRAYEVGHPGIGAALHGLRDAADRMTGALRAGDPAAVGRILLDNWRHQQALDPAMCTAGMARLEQAMRAAGSLGGKAAGAGAGGSMFFLAPDDPAPMIEAARSLDVRVLPVRWSKEGVRWC